MDGKQYLTQYVADVRGYRLVTTEDLSKMKNILKSYETSGCQKKFIITIIVDASFLQHKL